MSNQVQTQLCNVKILNAEEAEVYRKMPVGFSQDAHTLRTVAEKDGEKRILEITSEGFSITNVKP